MLNCPGFPYNSFSEIMSGNSVFVYEGYATEWCDDCGIIKLAKRTGGGRLSERSLMSDYEILVIVLMIMGLIRWVNHRKK